MATEALVWVREGLAFAVLTLSMVLCESRDPSVMPPHPVARPRPELHEIWLHRFVVLRKGWSFSKTSTLSIWRSRNMFIHSELRTAARGTRGHLGPN